MYAAASCKASAARSWYRSSMRFGEIWRSSSVRLDFLPTMLLKASSRCQRLLDTRRPLKIPGPELPGKGASRFHGSGPPDNHGVLAH